MIDTPAGPLAIDVKHGRLTAASFLGLVDEPVEDGAIADAIRRYVHGDLGALDDVPIEIAGTPLQERVWARLRRVPAGTTISYADLARAVGLPRGARAVGNALGANRCAVVVPCHRVVRSDGTLGGYGGGLHRKRALLAHEGVDVTLFD